VIGYEIMDMIYPKLEDLCQDWRPMRGLIYLHDIRHPQVGRLVAKVHSTAEP
jgi:hypothetical protein